MKLFVIVLCLLSERFLIHRIAQTRFYWFSPYFNALYERLPKTRFFNNDFVMVLWFVLPLVLLCWLILFIFSNWLFGLVGLVLHLIIFYYCLGPENTFYPLRQENEGDEIAAGNYFVKANNQLFAVIFWYILLGPLGALIYRLTSLCQQQQPTEKAAILLINTLDWLPSRLTVLFYLLVGNFQQGFHFFMQKLFTQPEDNEKLLNQGGLLAASTSGRETVTMPCAENIVEHAVVVCCVLLALFTLIVWF